MSTGFENRATLIKLIEEMDTPEIEMMQAFVAGYEVGKAQQTTPKQYVASLQAFMEKRGQG